MRTKLAGEHQFLASFLTTELHHLLVRKGEEREKEQNRTEKYKHPEKEATCHSMRTPGACLVIDNKAMAAPSALFGIVRETRAG